MQKTFCKNVIVTFLVILVSINWINANVCNTCMSNTVLCANETSYKICSAGVATGAARACPTGTKCTNSLNICEAADKIDGTTIISVCSAGESLCNKCSTAPDKLSYNCASTTQYGLCMNGVPSDNADLFECATDEFCSVDAYNKGLGDICMPTCVQTYLSYQPTCTNDVPTTPPPTLTDANIIAQCKKGCAKTPASCYTISPGGTSDCARYVYCEQSGTTWNYAVLVCPSGTYYSDTNKNCTGPACPAATTTTTTTTTTIAPGF